MRTGAVTTNFELTVFLTKENVTVSYPNFFIYYSNTQNWFKEPSICTDSVLKGLLTDFETAFIDRLKEYASFQKCNVADFLRHYKHWDESIAEDEESISYCVPFQSTAENDSVELFIDHQEVEYRTKQALMQFLRQ